MSERQRKIEKLSMDFLLDCAFGQHDDLVEAAIDKAYVDMASHTLKGFDDCEKKWECRNECTRIIRYALENYPNGKKSFIDWHKDVVGSIKKKYKKHVPFEEGQAQKWLNMTIKYIFVLKMVLVDDDKDRLSSVVKFISNTGEQDYYPPIDSFILKGAGIKEFSTWSSLTEEEYEKVMDYMGEEKDFLWELESWGEFAEKYREYEKDSYREYLDRFGYFG